MNNKYKASFIEIVKRIKKDQLVVLLLLGILLLVIAMPVEKSSSGRAEREREVSEVVTEDAERKTAAGMSYEESLSEKLESFLCQVDGVGNVRVLIKVKGTVERIVEKDEPFTEQVSNDRSEAGVTGSSRETVRDEVTVYEETQDGRQIPYVVKENAPEIEGVVIAAQGGDHPTVVQNIVEAVQALLQVEAHKIKVLKMK